MYLVRGGRGRHMIQIQVILVDDGEGVSIETVELSGEPTIETTEHEKVISKGIIDVFNRFMGRIEETQKRMMEGTSEQPSPDAGTDSNPD